MAVGSNRWLGIVNSPKPLPPTTDSDPIAVSFCEMNVLNTPSRRIAVHDGHGLGVGTEYLVALRSAIALEIAVYPLPCVTNEKVAKHIRDPLAMSGSRSWTPNPVLECPAAV